MTWSMNHSTNCLLISFYVDFKLVFKSDFIVYPKFVAYPTNFGGYIKLHI